MEGLPSSPEAEAEVRVHVCVCVLIGTCACVHGDICAHGSTSPSSVCVSITIQTITSSPFASEASATSSSSPASIIEIATTGLRTQISPPRR